MKRSKVQSIVASVARLGVIVLAGVACLGPARGAVPVILPSPGATGGAGAKAGAAVPVRFNAALLALSPGEEAELALPDGRRFSYAHDTVIEHGGGLRSWVGRSLQPGRGERAIVTVAPGAKWGSMQTPWGEYRLFTGEDGDWLAPAPARAAPTIAGGDAVRARDDPPGRAAFTGTPTPSPASWQKLSSLKIAPSPAFTLDLLVLYTADLAAKLGPALMPMMYNLVVATNAAFADSEVALDVRLVRAAPVDLPNSVGSGFALEGMAGNLSAAPYFESLTWGAGSLRDQVGADIVTLLRDNPAEAAIVAGIARILRNPVRYPEVGVTQSDAYSVLTTCATGCAGVYPHELGHNLGLMHDRATVARDSGGTVPTDIGVFPYAFGHFQCANGLTCDPFVAGGCATQLPSCANLQPNDFGTIMSYFIHKVNRYSSPGLRCLPAGGTAPGGFCGVEGQDDNVRALNETRQNASAYRNAVPALASLPGSLQFTRAVYAGTESGGAVTFTVSRIGGSTGKVSVEFATTGRTATSGADFTLASGALDWPSGDASDRTFTVPLVQDGLAERIESFEATLANPSGAFGVYLGHPATAVGVILEPWPPGGALPQGFTSAATPGAPWVVATDSFDPDGGDGASLKSGALPGDAPGTSSLAYTGTFVDGVVTFAYRVSSYPFDGGLEFLVDGVRAFAAKGDGAPWATAVVPVGAGVRTLEWRFSKVLGFPCRLAGGPSGETYPDCQDRAWIDSVGLPLPPEVPTFALAVSKSGVGTVTSVPTGIECGSDCIETYAAGTQVTLAAAPGAGFLFSGWGGACTGAGACVVSMDAARSVSAVFTIDSSLDADGDGIPDGVEPEVGRNPLAKDNDLFSPGAGAARLFAMQQYRDFLGREGDAAGIQGWTDLVTAGAYSRPQVIDAFVNSPEFGGFVAPVVRLYFATFLRVPDYAGLVGNAALVRNGTVTLTQLADFFANSPEFLATYGSLTNTQFVTLLYNNVLARAPDTAGLNGWVALLNGGMSRGQVLLGFSDSAEYQAAMAHEVLVTMMYTAMLRRTPEPAGFNGWVGFLDAATYTREQVINGFFLANEYRGRFLP